MSFSISRRFLLGGAGAFAALSVTGCAQNAAQVEAKQDGPVFFTNLGARVQPATPVNAPRITMPVIDAFKGDGLFYFDDNRETQFLITDPIRENNRYTVRENFGMNVPHGFSWGSGAVGIFRNAERIPCGQPSSVRTEGNYVVITFEGAKNMELRLTLDAYDVSGMEIRDFLRTRANQPTHAALFMGEERFPKGSVAYAVTAWVTQDELLARSATAFTGSDTIENFSKRFIKDTPYCLTSLEKDATPIGVRFEQAIVKKVVKRQEVAQNGQCHVYVTKAGTIFCQKDVADVLTKAKWNLRYVNGTRTLELALPSTIDPVSYGQMKYHAAGLLPAFAEERGAGNTHRVVPAVLWLKDKKIRDAQFRFNKTASEAIKTAIEASRPRREAWEQENETDVARRARLLREKNEAKAASAKKTVTKKTTTVKKTTAKKTTAKK